MGILKPFTDYRCESFVPSTEGNECYQPATGRGEVMCVATGSTVYQDPYGFGNYDASLAVDGQISTGNSGFYHSNLEHYPYLRIQFRKPDDSDYFAPIDLSKVVIHQRCNYAEEVYHQTQYEIRYTTKKDLDNYGQRVHANSKLFGGKLCAITSPVLITGG